MLGDEIRKARTEAGLTQETLAFRAGVSRQYVTGRHRHWYAKGVKPLFAANVKIKKRRRRS